VKGDKKQRFARSQIGTIVLDGRHLVLRDQADIDLIRQKIDGSMQDLTTRCGATTGPSSGPN
jgi:hypothetical protein